MDPQQAGLRRMKRLALALLVFVTALFLIAHHYEPQHTAWGYVRAFAEAAMVGALADWFAVTALFRHPLGIPIPHTAIIPHRKDQIGESLGRFVQDNFLTEEVLQERLAHAEVGRRLGVWLSEPANAAKAGSAVADGVRGGLEVIDDRDVGDALENLIEQKIRSTSVAPLLGRAIDITMDGGHHQRLLDALLAGLSNFIDDQRLVFRSRLAAESPWWIPEPIDDRIFQKVVTGAHSFLADIAANPQHEIRRSIDQQLQHLAQRLRTDPELMAKGEDIKADLLAHRDVRAWLESLWGEVKAALMTATADPGSDLRLRIDASLQRMGERLAVEPDLQAKVDQWVQRAAGYV
ncbi:MAG: DUF445 domain-containing protein, partial [Actinomycetota bacterium]